MSKEAKLFVAILVAATVFNDLAAFLPVGEPAKDAFTYLVPFGFLYLLRAPGKIALPSGFLLLSIALFVIVIWGVAVNYDDISKAWFKQRNGMSRVITQGMMVALGPMITLLFFNLALRGALPAISRGAWIGLLLMSGMAVVEVGSWFHIPVITQVHDLLSRVVHAGTTTASPTSSGQHAGRLRMTAFEASWAAVMLTFIFPFALSLGGRWRMVAVGVIVALLTLLLQSRTAMLVIGFQFLVLIAVMLRHRKDLAVHVGALSAIAILAMLLVPAIQRPLVEKGHNLIVYGSASGLLDKTKGVTENVSNVTRFAAIRAGTEMFHKSPLLGVGIGQFGFHYAQHIRAADLRSWEVRRYAIEAKTDDDWPPAYSLHVRLLAETGALGYLSWLAMVVPLLLRSLFFANRSSDHGRLHLAVAMTLVGWLMLGASIDSFRFFGGWIALGVALALYHRRQDPAQVQS